MRREPSLSHGGPATLVALSIGAPGPAPAQQPPPASGPCVHRVLSATTIDGLTWPQEAGVRLRAEPGEQITDPQVVRLSDGTWKMVYKVGQ